MYLLFCLIMHVLCSFSCLLREVVLLLIVFFPEEKNSNVTLLKHECWCTLLFLFLPYPLWRKQKYFHSSGDLDWNPKSSAARYVNDFCKPLQVGDSESPFCPLLLTEMVEKFHWLAWVALVWPHTKLLHQRLFIFSFPAKIIEFLCITRAF